jgi:N-acetylglucosamine malate deacetylase 1
MMEQIVVIAAHPDDEVLGCGGALALHAARGDKVTVLFLSDGELSREGASEQAVNSRVEAARRAAKELGITATHFLGFPDNQLDAVPRLKIVKEIEERCRLLRPTTVYTHHVGDLNVDHQVAYRATITAFRPHGGDAVKTILSFEIPSSTEWNPTQGEQFSPNLFIDVERFFLTKLKALEHYGSEMRDPPHPRSLAVIRALALLRGSQAGIPLAEAFHIVRKIN